MLSFWFYRGIDRFVRGISRKEKKKKEKNTITYSFCHLFFPKGFYSIATLQIWRKKLPRWARSRQGWVVGKIPRLGWKSLILKGLKGSTGEHCQGGYCTSIDGLWRPGSSITELSQACSNGRLLVQSRADGSQLSGSSTFFARL